MRTLSVTSHAATVELTRSDLEFIATAVRHANAGDHPQDSLFGVLATMFECMRDSVAAQGYMPPCHEDDFLVYLDERRSTVA